MSLTSTNTTPPPRTYFWGTNISCNSLQPSILSLSSVYGQRQRLFCCALKTGSQESYGSELLRKPIVSPPDESANDDHENDNGNDSEKQLVIDSGEEEERWVDWEDKILEDTVPLVGFVRMILHSGKYRSGDRLSPEHEKVILERLLPYHPESEKKIGCGVDYITIGYHSQFEESRCLFIVRTDGELVDFSYWKCIKGFIRKKYPLYADSFILKHFRRRRRYE